MTEHNNDHLQPLQSPTSPKSIRDSLEEFEKDKISDEKITNFPKIKLPCNVPRYTPISPIHRPPRIPYYTMSSPKDGLMDWYTSDSHLPSPIIQPPLIYHTLKPISRPIIQRSFSSILGSSKNTISQNTLSNDTLTRQLTLNPPINGPFQELMRISSNRISLETRLIGQKSRLETICRNHIEPIPRHHIPPQSWTQLSPCHYPKKQLSFSNIPSITPMPSRPSLTRSYMSSDIIKTNNNYFNRPKNSQLLSPIKQKINKDTPILLDDDTCAKSSEVSINKVIQSKINLIHLNYDLMISDEISKIQYEKKKKIQVLDDEFNSIVNRIERLFGDRRIHIENLFYKGVVNGIV